MWGNRICTKCGCLVSPKRAVSINVEKPDYGLIYDKFITKINKEYYCLEHRPKYDIRTNSEFFKVIPEHRIKVNKNGKLIKSIKD